MIARDALLPFLTAPLPGLVKTRLANQTGGKQTPGVTWITLKPISEQNSLR